MRPEELQLLLGLLCVGLPVYFLPTLVGALREHRNLAAVFVLNLLLGWTFLFWALALVWAFTSTKEKRYG